jgi:hypothetical protein
VQKPIAIAPVDSADQSLRALDSADTPKPAHLPPKTAGDLVHQERANQLHHELQEHGQHSLIMALTE